MELKRCPKCRVNVHDSCITKVREIDWSLFHGRQKYYPARYPFSRFNFWTSRLPFSSSHSIWDVLRSTRRSNTWPRNAPSLCTGSFRGPLLFANELPLIERKGPTQDGARGTHRRIATSWQAIYVIQTCPFWRRVRIDGNVFSGCWTA
jgi:hypothetical protein